MTDWCQDISFGANLQGVKLVVALMLAIRDFVLSWASTIVPFPKSWPCAKLPYAFGDESS